MLQKRIGAGLVVVLAACCGLGDAGEVKKKEKRTGTVIGEVKSKMNFKKGKNIFVEVQAPGEEKPRRYHVLYDPKVKGPNETVLAAVQACNVGDRVELEWVDTGEGLAMKSFKVLEKK